MKLVKTRNEIGPKLLRKAQDLQKIPQMAHEKFVSVTPRDSGRARRSTRLDGNTINADYPYATRLNQGWSKQAPQGMWEPTLKYIRGLVRRIIGR